MNIPMKEEYDKSNVRQKSIGKVRLISKTRSKHALIVNYLKKCERNLRLKNIFLSKKKGIYHLLFKHALYLSKKVIID